MIECNDTQATIFMQRPYCPICNSVSINGLYQIDFADDRFINFMNLEPNFHERFRHDSESGYFNGQTFRIGKCANCKFIFLITVLNDLGLRKLYDSWLDPHMTLMSHRTQNRLAKSLWYSQRINTVIRSFLGLSALNILDWGAGFGDFCMLAKGYDMNITALEFSREKKSQLEKLGIPVVTNSDILPPKHFHFIHVEQVLEHVLDPVGLLREVHKHLRDDGIAFVGVPNCAKVERLLKANILSRETFECVAPFQHVNAFTNKTLRLACKRAGFRVLFVVNAQPILFTRFTEFRHYGEILKNSVRPLFQNFLSTSLFLAKDHCSDI